MNIKFIFFRSSPTWSKIASMLDFFLDKITINACPLLQTVSKLQNTPMLCNFVQTTIILVEQKKIEYFICTFNGEN